MQSRPPEFIEPLRLARQGAQLSGRLPISQQQRLCEAIIGTDGDIEFSLEFGREAGGIHCIMGYLAATVNLQCQRCMETMAVALEGDIRLGIVQGEEEARRLPAEYEPLLVQDQSLRLAELVEDEVLLLLPMIPMHDDTGCAGDVAELTSEDDAIVPDDKTSASADTHRPFAEQLGSLRRRDK